MIIRKLFTGEMSHVVRNCTTERCSHSLHGHSYTVEVFLSADKLDNAGMLVDFGLLKTNIKSFIDSFDHCHVLWSKDKESVKEFIKSENDRWIELSVNPSAENLAIVMFHFISGIIESTKFNNGEGNVSLQAVRYHETTTGYAEASFEDLEMLPREFSFDFSAGVVKDWREELTNFMAYETRKASRPETLFEPKIFFENPKIELQVK